MPLEVEPLDEVLHGTVAGSAIAETRLRRIRANRHRFERRLTDIQNGDPEVLHVLHLDDGHVEIEQDGRNSALRVGDLVLYSSSRPFRVMTEGRFQFTIGLLPARLLPMSGRLLRECTARPTQSSDGVAAPLSALLRSLATGRTSGIGPEQQLAVQNSLIGLLAAYATAGTSSSFSSPSVHAMTARNYIVRSLGDPRLGPTEVADACGVSVSYLHRLFARDGTTVAGYIREQRLRGAHHDLATMQGAERVSAVGERWGIPDPSQFSHMFKQRFGATPSEVGRRSPGW